MASMYRCDHHSTCEEIRCPAYYHHRQAKRVCAVRHECPYVADLFVKCRPVKGPFGRALDKLGVVWMFIKSAVTANPWK